MSHSIIVTFHILISLMLLSCHSTETDIDPDLQLLKQLSENPSQAVALCTQFQNSAYVDRCNAIAMRPHLWHNPTSQKTTQSTRKIGPASKHLLPKAQIHHPSPKPPSVSICGKGEAANGSGGGPSYSGRR